MTNCEKCKFFVRHNTDGGQCYRLPPSVSVHYDTHGTPGNTQFDNLRPYVSNTEWCGEFSLHPSFDESPPY